MAFDEIQLPLRVGFGSQGGPRFSTEIITVDGGHERRNQNWSAPRRTYDAATGLRSASDVSILLSFFYARAGRARGFRLKDWSDYTSATNGTDAPHFSDQTLGMGDDSQTEFPLIKVYSSGGVTYTRSIKKPVAGSVTLAVNGVLIASGWSVDTASGMVTFAAAPLAGAVITAGFQFDVPVRFDTDQLSLSAEDFQLMRSSIPLMELRL